MSPVWCLGSGPGAYALSPLSGTLLPTLALSYGIQAAVAIPSVIFKSERYYDFSGSLTHISCVALSLGVPFLCDRVAFLPNWRQVALSAGVIIWATRLGSYLLIRILKTGEDSRFNEIKKNPIRFSVAFFLQATWVSLICLPVWSLNAVPSAAFAVLPRVTPTDVIGLTMWVVGMTTEVVADLQMDRWKADKREKKHSEEFMTRGLWGRSRHPNYFGEMLLWTGTAVVSAGILVRRPVQVALGLSKAGRVGGVIAALALAAVSPAFTSLLLLKVSGIPLSEKKYDSKYGHVKEYREWKENTPMLIPRLWKSKKSSSS